jgi:hypothetical protein
VLNAIDEERERLERICRQIYEMLERKGSGHLAQDNLTIVSGHSTTTRT